LSLFPLLPTFRYSVTLISSWVFYDLSIVIRLHSPVVHSVHYICWHLWLHSFVCTFIVVIQYSLLMSCWWRYILVTVDVLDCSLFYSSHVMLSSIHLLIPFYLFSVHQFYCNDPDLFILLSDVCVFQYTLSHYSTLFIILLLLFYFIHLCCVFISIHYLLYLDTFILWWLWYSTFSDTFWYSVDIYSVLLLLSIVTIVFSILFSIPLFWHHSVLTGIIDSVIILTVLIHSWWYSVVVEITYYSMTILEVPVLFRSDSLLYCCWLRIHYIGYLFYYDIVDWPWLLKLAVLFLHCCTFICYCAVFWRHSLIYSFYIHYILDLLSIADDALLFVCCWFLLFMPVFVSLLYSISRYCPWLSVHCCYPILHDVTLFIHCCCWCSMILLHFVVRYSLLIFSVVIRDTFVVDCYLLFWHSICCVPCCCPLLMMIFILILLHYSIHLFHSLVF